MHFVESWQRLARTGEAGGSFSGKPNIRPISAYFEDVWSFRTSARILVSLLTRRSNERRGEHPPNVHRRAEHRDYCRVARDSTANATILKIALDEAPIDDCAL